jgi:RNA polymerase sigma factor (sigma-70 family)
MTYKILIEEHYRLNFEKLIKQSRYRVPNQSVHLAEECVQEAYVRALKYFNAFNPDLDTFDMWFRGILRNAINDCRTIEKDRGVTKELTEDLGEVVASKEEKAQYALVKKHINAEPKNRNILTLFFILGYKSKDISEYTSITHTYIRQIIFRFRNKMNDILETID